MRLWFLLVVRPVVRLGIGVGVLGRGHLRYDQPVVIVANHNSHLDALVLMDLMSWGRLRNLRPVAAADYFEKSRLTRFMWMRCMNALPIRRDRVDRHHNPLTAMIEALDRGESLLLFPEGTRGDPEQLSTFRTGIAHLLRKRPETPIVPVYMRNLGFSLPRGEVVLVPLFCDVYIGRPRKMSGRRNEIMQQIEHEFEKLRGVAERLRRSADDDDE